MTKKKRTVNKRYNKSSKRKRTNKKRPYKKSVSKKKKRTNKKRINQKRQYSKKNIKIGGDGEFEKGKFVLQFSLTGDTNQEDIKEYIQGLFGTAPLSNSINLGDNLEYLDNIIINIDNPNRFFEIEVPKSLWNPQGVDYDTIIQDVKKVLDHHRRNEFTKIPPDIGTVNWRNFEFDETRFREAEEAQGEAGAEEEAEVEAAPAESLRALHWQRQELEKKIMKYAMKGQPSPADLLDQMRKVKDKLAAKAEAAEAEAAEAEAAPADSLRALQWQRHELEKKIMNYAMKGQPPPAALVDQMRKVKDKLAAKAEAAEAEAAAVEAAGVTAMEGRFATLGRGGWFKLEQDGTINIKEKVRINKGEDTDVYLQIDDRVEVVVNNDPENPEKEKWKEGKVEQIAPHVLVSILNKDGSYTKPFKWGFARKIDKLERIKVKPPGEIPPEEVPIRSFRDKFSDATYRASKFFSSDPKKKDSRLLDTLGSFLSKTALQPELLVGPRKQPTTDDLIKEGYGKLKEDYLKYIKNNFYKNKDNYRQIIGKYDDFIDKYYETLLEYENKIMERDKK